jgi:drug/metabolite transporter (DMT)-like permease
MINWIPLAFASVMATIDAMSFSALKEISTKAWPMAAFPLVILFYAIQPVIFFKSLKFESMTVMNLMWDLMSDVLVTFVGIFILGEKIGFRKAVGIVLSFIALYLFTFEDGHSLIEKQIEGMFGFKPI